MDLKELACTRRRRSPAHKTGHRDRGDNFFFHSSRNVKRPNFLRTVGELPADLPSDVAKQLPPKGVTYSLDKKKRWEVLSNESVAPLIFCDKKDKEVTATAIASKWMDSKSDRKLAAHAPLYYKTTPKHVLQRDRQFKCSCCYPREVSTKTKRQQLKRICDTRTTQFKNQ